MGQSNCYSVKTVDKGMEEYEDDGNSYENDITYRNSVFFSPRTIQLAPFDPPDESFAEVYSLLELRELDDQISPEIKQALQTNDPLNFPQNPNFQFSNLVFRITKDNYAYCGQWKDKKPNGFGIQYHFKPKYFYEGESLKGLPHGRGRKILPDGSSLEGNFVYGLLNGKGIFKTLKLHRYDGDFQENRPHGMGKEQWADGSTYVGTYNKGMKENGKFTWVNQNPYKNFSSGNESYEGQFKQNLFHGMGRYLWADGRFYEGEWQYGCMHGSGKYSYPDGRTYEGNFENDQKHGHGVMTWSDKKSWQGQWKHGRMDGIGIFYDQDGKAHEGEWKNGERIRWINSQGDPNTSFTKSMYKGLDQSMDDTYENGPTQKKTKNLDLNNSINQFGETVNSMFVSEVK